MADLQVNTLATGPIGVGEELQLTIDIPANAKYVLELTGTAKARVGIFQGTQIIGSNGKLSVCGTNVRGTRELIATTHLLRVQGLAAGTYGVKVRPWSFTDYFTIGFYKSSC